MAKMFYTSDEAAQKLNMSQDGLKDLVTQNRLREFRDGNRVMFKVDQVDKVVSERQAAEQKKTGDTGLSDSGIALAPSDSAAGDAISLSDTAHPTAKDDTVAAAPGQSDSGVKVFESGEMKAVDASAQTQIQPPTSDSSDQLSLEGVGSGSGLLDLTRESDDTSLGAELLDEIYPGGDAKGESGIASASGIFEQAGAGDVGSSTGLENVATSAPVATSPMIAEVEAADPSAEAFGGMAFASLIVMVVGIIVVGSFFRGYSPQWVETVTANTTNLFIFAGALVLVSAILTGIGMFIGKASR
ncbi:MAG TPA: helix-turn-helix domain-containing protein [Phycisphaerae bacterium]|nr:helix-turn-helix domain-containing protein [Phycisphaerae bacterium]